MSMIVSSPVRVANVRVKALIPGRYGSVILGKHQSPGWVDIRWSAPGTTIEELRAAAKTLLEIADAREGGAPFAEEDPEE